MVVFLVVFFFTIFFGVMMLGNHMSHLIERITSENADQTLYDLNQELDDQLKS
ncbi:hypothetical protein RYX45_04455 [Alkalihalophilus pseudofirmus]|uniref:Uncharacterized protein n=1 Tax=Alkalihalophilus pseudofirmus TaxID=79885 RepID=A0AAJ2NMN7_ALKPS|nr:hypothetical protein [Alkalihalophilus pseudofirmus]MDV2884420.1 hypothetical protein [Alkalihalophilus pseudofirmus]